MPQPVVPSSRSCVVPNRWLSESFRRRLAVAIRSLIHVLSSFIGCAMACSMIQLYQLG